MNEVRVSAAEEVAVREMQVAARQRLLDRPISVIGFMGAGKTSLGRALGKELGRPFHDTDRVIERTHGRPIVDYFAAGEEAVFRELESQTVAELVRADPAVIALGGGTLDAGLNRDLIFGKTFAVHLVVSWAAVRREMRQLAGGRPMMNNRSEADLHELFLRRQRTYSPAHLRISPPRGDVKKAAAYVISCLLRLADST
ncbi:MAG TPA: shikimate kinase [Solirubrobacterales bacterium]